MFERWRLFYKVINHSIGVFKNYENGATTNNLESMGIRARKYHRARSGTHRTTLDSNFLEFMYGERFKNSVICFIEHILEDFF